MVRIIRRTAFGLGLAAFAAASAAAWTGANASQLIYQPINPAFGGDPFVGSFLMETALAQNRFTQEPGFPDIDFPDFSDIIIVPPATPDPNADETAAPQLD